MKTVMKKNSNLMLILSCGLLMVAALPVEGFFFFDIPLWFQQPCIFTCTNPNSNATRTNVTSPTTMKGCQALNLTLTDLSQNQTQKFDQCCNSIISCYNLCGSKKRDCDFALKTCMWAACKENKNNKYDNYEDRPSFRQRETDRDRKISHQKCELVAKQMKKLVKKDYCPTFLYAQKNACNC